MALNCTSCGSIHIIKYGIIVLKKKGKTQRLKCQSCGSIFYQ